MRDTQQIKTVADVPSDYQLIQDSQDINATLESIGREAEIGEWGCLFAQVEDGDYGHVYACERYVPVLTHRVYQIR